MKVTNPFLFHPGDGQPPPYLAGRESEQNVLRQFLGALQAGAGPPSNVVLIGPRGNGKTALLRWFEVEAATAGIDAVWLTPNKSRHLDQLAQELAPAARFGTRLPDDITIHLGVSRLGWQLDDSRGALTRLVAARCMEKPLVVLLDEAHNLDKEVGSDLLNTSQEVRVQAPFLLILAGTPGLRRHLNTTPATFSNRCKKLGIDLLDETAAAAALEKPLSGEGVTFTEAALAEVLKKSQCYPYFLQLWGAALWAQVQATGSRQIDVSLVASTRQEVEAGCNDYYRDRYEELEQRGLLGTALNVAVVFAETARLSDRELNQALAGPEKTVGLDPPAAVLESREALQALGFVWKPIYKEEWEPGIPSLMEYLQARRLAPELATMNP